MHRAGLLPLIWAGAVGLLCRTGATPNALLRAAESIASGELPTGEADPEGLLLLIAGTLAWLLLAWLGLGALAVIGARAAGRVGNCSRRLVRALLPQAVRRLLETTVGLTVAVSASSAAPALAVPTATIGAVESASTAGPPGAPDVLPSLDRQPATTIQLAPLPAVPAPVLAPAAPVVGRATIPDPVLVGRLPESQAIVVHHGDCLWSLVARALGPTASDADVARAVPQWYAANRSVIGADPGLLLPGQRLAPPSVRIP